FAKVLQNTIVFALVTGPIGYAISFFSAWLINDLPHRLRTFMTLIFYSPALAGNVYFIWTILFSNDEKGWINGFLMQLGVITDPMLWLTDTKLIMGVLILVQLWSCLGAGFLSFIAGFQSLDPTLFEAAALDGIKNRWQELWFVTIPQMSSNLLFSAVMTIGSSFGVGTIISAIAGTPTAQYKADTIVTYISEVGTVRFEMGYASAIAVVLFLLMLVTNFVITRLLQKFSTD
ncbi:MAG: sugar ABC transporter permease, partial [Angelakisella sp.]